VNLVALFVLRGGDRANLNVRAALLHVLGDLLGSIGAIAAAIVILATGWTPIDPILSIFLTLLILRGARDVTRRAGHVLMEGVPEGFDAATMRADLMSAVLASPTHHARVDAQHRTVGRHVARVSHRPPMRA
jgi:cobalt-zinc-cadmium efflux system protein